jgi:hypothetical protein
MQGLAGVHISDGLLDAQPNAQIANYPFGVSHGVVSDLRLEQQNMGRLTFGVFAGGGAYRMRFLRVNVTRGVSFMACNGIAGCYFEDVFGTVIKKGLEFARYSHSTTVSRATLRILPESNEAGIMLYVPEASHRILFADCDVDVRGKVPLVNDTTQLAGIFGASGFTAGSRFNVLRRTKILADRFSKGFSITGTTDRPTMGNEIADSTITADNSEIPLRISTPGPDDKRQDGPPRRHRLQDRGQGRERLHRDRRRHQEVHHHEQRSAPGRQEPGRAHQHHREQHQELAELSG